MKSLKQNKWMVIVYAVLLVTIGVLTVVLAITDSSWIGKIISYALAVALFVVGVMHIVSALVAHTSDFFTASLVLASVAIAVGIVLCVKPNIIGDLITYFVGAFACAIGAVALAKGIVLAKFKQKGSWVATYICIAVVSIALGVVFFCLPSQSLKAIYILAGTFFALSGITELVVGIKALSAKKD